MSERLSLNRLILCVDGHEYRPDGTKGNTNESNVYRLKNLVAKGLCRDSSGRTITQTIRYHKTASVGPSLVDKLRNSSHVGHIEGQIKDLTREVCQILTSSQDELFLYGFGRGAFVVRAVAGALYHMGLPTIASLPKFEDLYQNALDLYKARSNNDNKSGPAIQQFLKSQTTAPPQIRFMGLFDSTQPTGDTTMFDVSFNSSINIVRHALALNESGTHATLDMVEFPKYQFDVTGSLLQAWFVGTHSDLGGGAQHDGLSLYPLQWMILESMRAGLVIASPEGNFKNPLSIAFPQFAGGVPKLDESEKIEWQTLYKNGIQISMFDLQSVHSPNKSEEDSTHDVRLSDHDALYRYPRKVFDAKAALLGWSEKVAMGTVIHPSVFCLWDRYSRLQEHTRFKILKTELSTFREQCMTNTGVLPPWLEDSQLQASGVKAFRILVCGKTGVGKSTLINKIFGVEMTEESQTYSQGVHDINQAFESPSTPGLFIHDSRGWQAGSEQELDLIAKFLRHRAFQKDPTQALHVIWFCLDSDVSRIEEADKRTFATIAKFSHHVPVFVVGTKKDKLVAFRKMELLERFMKETGDFQEASRKADLEADKLAEEQFSKLREQLAQIEHYKADGYVCLSKDDTLGVRSLLNQTIGMITDERVRLFCVAAQVVDVDQKINSAITECLRLGVHAVRTAMVPLPFSSSIATPTVSRILVEHILQCFGFPKAAPEEVEAIMLRIVLGNLKSFMTVSITQFIVMGGAATGVAMATVGAGAIFLAAACIIAAPPTARMLVKCACDMILILERSFRYGGKFVSTKQIEDAATYYAVATIKVDGKEMLLQRHVHDQVNKLIPLRKVSMGWNLNSIRGGFEEIVFNNRFDQLTGQVEPESKVPELDADGTQRVELPGDNLPRIELPSDTTVVPLELDSKAYEPLMPELEGDLGYGAGTQSSFNTNAATRRSSNYESVTSTSTGARELRQLRDERHLSLTETVSTDTIPEFETASSYDGDSYKRSNGDLLEMDPSGKPKRSFLGKRLSSRFKFSRSKSGSENAG